MQIGDEVKTRIFCGIGFQIDASSIEDFASVATSKVNVGDIADRLFASYAVWKTEKNVEEKVYHLA